MSYIESYEGTNPSGNNDIMAKIYIDSQAVLRLSDSLPIAGQYTLQLWIKSGTDQQVYLEANGIHTYLSANTEWTKYIFTFDVTNDTDRAIYLQFPVGVYYLYHVKVEFGDTASDWTPAPEFANRSVANEDDTRLFRLSDKYTDKLSCDNGLWYIERNTELMTLDGTEDGWEQIINNTYRLKISNRGDGNTILPALSDHFAYSDENFLNMPVNSMHVANISYDGVQTTFLHIRVNDSIASTRLGWCEWLESNPVKVLIPAEKSTLTPLANYVQTILNNAMAKGDLSVYMTEDNVHSLRGSVIVKPIVFGTVNEDMSVLINNMSDDDIGFIYEIHCKGAVVNPVIYHTESGQHIKINGSFKRDDIITIDTRRGHKSVTKTYMGSESNIINNFDNTSKWLELQSGYNHLVQSADSGADNMDSVIIYTNEYEGV